MFWRRLPIFSRNLTDLLFCLQTTYWLQKGIGPRVDNVPAPACQSWWATLETLAHISWKQIFSTKKLQFFVSTLQGRIHDKFCKFDQFSTPKKSNLPTSRIHLGLQEEDGRKTGGSSSPWIKMIMNNRSKEWMVIFFLFFLTDTLWSGLPVLRQLFQR